MITILSNMTTLLLYKDYNLTQMTIISTTVGRNPLQETE